MPTNLVLCARNAIDSATVTATPAAIASLPPSNLQLPSRGRVMRTTSTAPVDIMFTWGGQGWLLNFLKFARHNLESGAVWRVQLFSDAAWTNQIYDSRIGGVDLPAFQYLTLGELDFGVSPLGSSVFDGFLGQQYSLVYFPRVMALSGIATIANAGNSAGYLQGSRLFAGDYSELAWNPESADFGWDEATTQSRSEGGSLRSDGSVSFRTLDFQLAIKDEVQRANLADILRYAGLRKELFMSLYPGVGGEKERDYTMLGKFVGRLPKISTTAGTDILKTRLSFQEN